MLEYPPSLSATPVPIYRETIPASKYREPEKPREIKTLIIHDTESASLQGALNVFKDPAGPEVSAHYLIDRDGRIIQLVSDANIAFHARGRNDDSIGVELVHRKVDGDYTPQQISSLVALLRYLTIMYKIDVNNILTHQQVEPERRTDGPTSRIDEIRKAVSGAPAPAPAP